MGPHDLSFTLPHGPGHLLLHLNELASRSVRRAAAPRETLTAAHSILRPPQPLTTALMPSSACVSLSRSPAPWRVIRASSHSATAAHRDSPCSPSPPPERISFAYLFNSDIICSPGLTLSSLRRGPLPARASSRVSSTQVPSLCSTKCLNQLTICSEQSLSAVITVFLVYCGRHIPLVQDLFTVVSLTISHKSFSESCHVSRAALLHYPSYFFIFL